MRPVIPPPSLSVSERLELFERALPLIPEIDTLSAARLWLSQHNVPVYQIPTEYVINCIAAEKARRAKQMEKADV